MKADTIKKTVDKVHEAFVLAWNMGSIKYTVFKSYKIIE